MGGGGGGRAPSCCLARQHPLSKSCVGNMSLKPVEGEGGRNRWIETNQNMEYAVGRLLLVWS